MPVVLGVGGEIQSAIPPPLMGVALVARWIRADGFYPSGRRFESCRGHESRAGERCDPVVHTAGRKY